MCDDGLLADLTTSPLLLALASSPLSVILQPSFDPSPFPPRLFSRKYRSKPHRGRDGHPPVRPHLHRPCLLRPLHASIQWVDRQEDQDRGELSAGNSGRRTWGRNDLGMDDGRAGRGEGREGCLISFTSLSSCCFDICTPSDIHVYNSLFIER
jgi:hypothetical protein